MDDTPLTDNINFYLVKIGDIDGSSAHGPYSEDAAIEKRGKDEQVISKTRLERLKNPQPAVKTKKQPLEPGVIHAKMVSDIRQWGRALLFLGVIHLIASGLLNSSWGVILVVVGLLSFLFQTSSMYVIYGIVLGWAAVTNALSGETVWILLALFQLYLTVQIFRSFFRYRKAEAQVAEMADEIVQSGTKNRLTAAFLFTWSGCIVGMLSLVILVGSFASVVVLGALRKSNIDDSTFEFLLSLSLELGVFAFALGLASLLSRYRYKLASIGGIIVGVLTIVIMVVLFFIAS
jgi:hypothetical protein